MKTNIYVMSYTHIYYIYITIDLFLNILIFSQPGLNYFLGIFITLMSNFPNNIEIIIFLLFKLVLNICKNKI